jgi:protein TonB
MMASRHVGTEPRAAAGAPAGPGWTWRGVAGAAAATAGIFLALPYLDATVAGKRERISVRGVDSAAVAPAPPVEPAVRRPSVPERAAPPPVPRLEEAPRPPLALAASLDMAPAPLLPGDAVDISFPLASEATARPEAVPLFEVHELDEPPRPLVQLRPVYPHLARLRGLGGVVVVEFVVSRDGSTRDPAVLSAQPCGVFEDAALRAIRQWRFIPGTRGGKAVPVRVRQRVSFEQE